MRQRRIIRLVVERILQRTARCGSFGNERLRLFIIDQIGDCCRGRHLRCGLVDGEVRRGRTAVGTLAFDCHRSLAGVGIIGILQAIVCVFGQLCVSILHGDSRRLSHFVVRERFSGNRNPAVLHHLGIGSTGRDVGLGHLKGIGIVVCLGQRHGSDVWCTVGGGLGLVPCSVDFGSDVCRSIAFVRGNDNGDSLSGISRLNYSIIHLEGDGAVGRCT